MQQTDLLRETAYDEMENTLDEGFDSLRNLAGRVDDDLLSIEKELKETNRSEKAEDYLADFTVYFQALDEKLNRCLDVLKKLTFLSSLNASQKSKTQFLFANVDDGNNKEFLFLHHECERINKMNPTELPNLKIFDLTSSEAAIRFVFPYAVYEDNQELIWKIFELVSSHQLIPVRNETNVEFLIQWVRRLYFYHGLLTEIDAHRDTTTPSDWRQAYDEVQVKIDKIVLNLLTKLMWSDVVG